MAALIRSPAVTVTVLVALVSVLWLCTESYGRTLVGGRTEITDVKRNKEVQELGRFSVEEYNRSLRMWRKTAEEEVEFVEVVEAQEQVVSGIKYYMKISATQSGASRMFDSVLVVKPWLRSKQLLDFAPSSQFGCKARPWCSSLRRKYLILGGIFNAHNDLQEKPEALISWC